MKSEYTIDTENKWIPDGFHFLGPQASKKRRQLLEQLAEYFRTRDYSEVIVPSFDFTSSFVSHLVKSEKDTILKARDLQGNEISPGLDLTIQVVKGMAGYLEIGPNHRVFYRGTIIKDNHRSNTDRREIMQVGAEIIGNSDSETFIQLLQQIDEICKLLTLTNRVTIVLGNVRIFSALAYAMGMNHKQVNFLASLVHSKNVKDIEDYLTDFSGNAELKQAMLDILLQFEPTPIRKVIAKISDSHNLGLESELAQLDNIIRFTKTSLQAVDLCIDFSLLPDLDYYTGFVFHGYTDRVPFPIFIGGAYDQLYEKFSGQEKPACGFAINVDLLEEMI